MPMMEKQPKYANYSLRRYNMNNHSIRFSLCLWYQFKSYYLFQVAACCFIKFSLKYFRFHNNYYKFELYIRSLFLIYQFRKMKQLCLNNYHSFLILLIIDAGIIRLKMCLKIRYYRILDT